MSNRELVRLFDREVKTDVRTDQEVWDLHTNVTKRLTAARTPGRVAIARVDYDTTLALCIERGLLIDAWDGESPGDNL